MSWLNWLDSMLKDLPANNVEGMTVRLTGTQPTGKQHAQDLLIDWLDEYMVGTRDRENRKAKIRSGLHREYTKYGARLRDKLAIAEDRIRDLK